MKGKRYSLLSILGEDATIDLPDTQDQVRNILDEMPPEEAAEAFSGAMEDDPDLVQNVIDNSPEAIENYLKASPESTDKLTGALEDPEVMDTLSHSPEAVASMSQYYSDNPDDIPDEVVKQISQADSDEMVTPEGDILDTVEESYDHMLSRWHIDGQPWSGSLQDLAAQQGRSWGGGDLVDPREFDKEVRTSVKFATGTAKSPLKMTERKLRELIRNVLIEVSVR